MAQFASRNGDGLVVPNSTSFSTRNLFHQVTMGASSKTIDNVSEVFRFLGSGSILLA